MKNTEKSTQTTSIQTELEITRTVTVSEISCSGCEAKAEAREIRITPPKKIGRGTTWTRLPEGWWGQDGFSFDTVTRCPSCMETLLSSVATRN